MIALIVCAGPVLSGCASVSDDAQHQSLDALATQVPPPLIYDPKTPDARVDCDRPLFASLRPDALPPRGQMPPGSYMHEIHERGELEVGVDQNTLRLGYFDPGRQRMEGLDIALVREIARAIFGDLEDRIVFKAISTAQRTSVIESEEVDMVVSAFSIDCDRLKRMYFSSVYYQAQQRLLVPRDSPVDSLSDLRGRKVCATKGSTSIKNLAGTSVVAHPVALRPDCLVELQEGKVAAITSDDSILFGFMEQDPQTKIVGRCINVERYGIAINRGHPELVRFVNAVLRRMGPDGLERIRKRWLKDLRAPTGADIRQCDRRAQRRRDRLEAKQLRDARQARAYRARWLRGLAAPSGSDILCARCALRAST